MRHLALPLLGVTILLSTYACGGGGGAGPGGGDDAGPPTADDGGIHAHPDDAGTPDATPTTVDPSPTNPADDGGGALGWAPAPLMNDVGVVPNRDSAVVVVPAVDGAVDYRVITIPAGVKVSVDGSGHESIAGSRITCAGYRQHNKKAAERELLRQIEVAGLRGATRLVVEAIDAPCPFPGVVGATHAVVPAPEQDLSAPDLVPTTIFTDDEVRATYGSVIRNGQGPGASLGAPAAPTAPKVLARTTVKVTPLGNGAPIVDTFFDDFSDENDQPKVLQHGDPGSLFISQSSRWTFYAAEANQAQAFIRDARMHFVLADQGGDIFGSQLMIPRKPVHLSDTDYVHVTFEVASNSSDRRYWWISLCGADQPGQTLAADGSLTQPIIQSPFFMDPDGKNPSQAGWNCFQIFTRNGAQFELPPGGYPESEIRVMLNKAGNHPTDSVINVSPDQYKFGWLDPSWFRQQDGAGNLTAQLLDDQVLIAPNARFDMFLRRDRVVLYVNGEQRLCNGFKSTPLTMAEGALGFGQVLYHSTAERLEILQSAGSSWDRTGQRYYLENTPYVDERTWDNVGFGEHVALPSGGVAKFDESACYEHP